MENQSVESQGFQVLALDQGNHIQFINLIHISILFISPRLYINPKIPRVRVFMREQGQGFHMARFYLCQQRFYTSILIPKILTTIPRTIHSTYNISCWIHNKICHLYLKVTYLCLSDFLFLMQCSFYHFYLRHA